MDLHWQLGTRSARLHHMGKKFSRVAHTQRTSAAAYIALAGLTLTVIARFGKLPPNPQIPSQHYDAKTNPLPDVAPIHRRSKLFRRLLSHIQRLNIRSDTVAPLSDSQRRDLHQAIDTLTANHPDQTGVYLLSQGTDAFAARLAVIMSAEKSLDLQYYIWDSDVTGMLLFQAVRQAAERGVRVRLLIDDNNTLGNDPIFVTLNRYPNIEVRLYNPNRYRTLRWLGFIGDLPRLNRRMHNKSLTADNRVSITGGRNIGDEYFAVEGNVFFADLDTLLIGQVVPQISQDFDRYWNSALAYPVEAIVRQRDTSRAVVQYTARRLRRQNRRAKALRKRYLALVKNTAFVTQLRAKGLPLFWARVELVGDDPDKTLGFRSGKLRLRRRVSREFMRILRTPTRQLRIVSPYFVPTKAGTRALIQLAKQGVDIGILTNAMSATDVKIVHSGYAKYRKRLLRHGIDLYEMKPNARTEKFRDKYITGSTGSSLHAKTFEIDGQKIFIGSYNFDPRSEQFNTEMGVIVHSPALAQTVFDGLQQNVPTASYRVRLKFGRLRWITHEHGKTLVYTHEPNTQAWERAAVWLLAHLPFVEVLL
ncbi:phospholipase D family protein [Faucicola atlantae]|uniref:phospholipase D family protein n=1 Tax=Faucicola atlantae TaxID=34059 RepID=UPI0025AF55F6|nr:phospholipase D family protein [Moraxella atlantae]